MAPLILRVAGSIPQNVQIQIMLGWWLMLFFGTWRKCDFQPWKSPEVLCLSMSCTEPFTMLFFPTLLTQLALFLNSCLCALLGKDFLDLIPKLCFGHCQTPSPVSVKIIRWFPILPWWPNKQSGRLGVLLLFNLPPDSVFKNPPWEYSHLHSPDPDPQGILHSTQLQFLQGFFFASIRPLHSRPWQSTHCNGQSNGLARFKQTTVLQHPGNALALVQRDQVDLRIWSGIGGRVEEAQNPINQQDSREIQRMLWISFKCVLMMVLECWTSFLGLLFLVVGCSTWEDPLSKPVGLRKGKLHFTVILPGFNLSWRDGKIAWKCVSRL